MGIISTMLLPELIEYIFTLCSSKDRSILCQVSKEWYVMALSVSKRLSQLSYDNTIYNDDTLYKSGDYHLIVRLKSKCATLYYACIGGNIDVVKLMISHNAFTWNWGLQGACEGGHLELAK
jgi:hypothetical protein